MVFHENYSNLLTQLPPSLINAGWIWLITRKKNPLSESEASSISPIIEAFLKHEVDRYQKNKKSRYNPTIKVKTESHCIVIPVSNLKKTGFEEETKSRISDSSSNSLLYKPEGSLL